MRSKAFQSFETKLAYFDDDIELIDVLRTAVLEGDLTDPASNRLLKRVDIARHGHLKRRRNSDGSRKNTINHLRSSIYANYIKDAYEEVTDYLRLILYQASANGFSSGRIIGEHSFKMDAKEVLDLGDWSNLCQAVTDSVFQALESERSTIYLLTKMANKLGLEIEQQLMDDALPYLKLRHFLVHAGGKLTPGFAAKYPQIPRKTNGRLDLRYSLIVSARDAIKALIWAYDAEVVAKGLLAQDALMP